jgi:hypothetical protein
MMVMSVTSAFIIVAALFVGAAAAWVLRGREVSMLRESFERERTDAEVKMLGQFQRLAQQTLGNVTTSFLDLATTKLSRAA